MEVEESMLEEYGREEAIPSTVEDEVQISFPPTPAHQVLAFVKTIQNSTPHYISSRQKSLALP